MQRVNSGWIGKLSSSLDRHHVLYAVMLDLRTTGFRSDRPLHRLSSTLPNRPLNVAVLGASGAVGQELLLLLEERRFPVGELKLLASARSAGQTQTWNGRTLTVEEVSAQSFEGVDLVLASAGGSVS